MSPLASLHFRRLLAVFLSLVFSFVAIAAETVTKSFNVPAGTAEKTLKQFSEQAGVQVLFPTDRVQGVRTNAVKGELTPVDALEQMVVQTELVVIRDDKTGALGIKRAATVAEAEKNGSSRPASDRTAVGETTGTIKLDTFEVMGTKLLNMDIPRSRDDAQPYVIFDRAKIEQSGAVNVEDFLKDRLTMNTESATAAQTGSIPQASSINLRGLGTNQTLILVDGRRIPPSFQNGSPRPADISGIPIAAVERIEVLPTTSSGIYGGEATGGVINIILRRDYAGAELKLTYRNTFDTDAAIRRADFNAGFTLEGGKTNVLLAASYSDANALLVQDRDFVTRYLASIMANNPAFFLTAATPPMGSTTNIRSVNGSPLFGPGTPNITFVPLGYAGGGGLAPLQANAGKYNLALAHTARSGSIGGGKQSQTTNATVESLMATIRRQFTPTIQVFLEAAAARNTVYNNISQAGVDTFTLPAAAPNNPFGQAILATIPMDAADGRNTFRNRDSRLAAGVIFKLPGSWQGEADLGWSESSSGFLFAPSLNGPAAKAAVASGALDVLRDTNAYPLDFSPYLVFGKSYTSPALRSTLLDANLRLSGTVLELPAGALSLSGLLGRRENTFPEATFVNYSGNTGVQTFNFVPRKSQVINSVYLEAKVPLVSGQNKIPGVHDLELQAAGRFDGYTINGAQSTINLAAPTPVVAVKNKITSTNPTIGVRYVPVQDVILRASYGTGFLPPTVIQLNPNPIVTTAGGAFDPKRGGEILGNYQLLSGGGPSLQPEKSKTWSVGAVFTPRIAAGVRLSIDYSRIEKSSNIARLSMQQLLDNESVFPGRVIRGSVLPGDPFGIGPVTILDDTSVNISRAMVEAYDVQLDWHRETTSAGTFDVFAAATWQTHYQTQLVPTTPVVENVGLGLGNPLKLRANGGLTWQRDHWTLGWSVRYFDSYLVADPTATGSATLILNQGSPRVPSQVYHDFFATYKFSPHAENKGRLKMLDRLELQVGVKNVFNAKPPLDAAAQFPLGYSTYGDPRLAEYYFSAKKSF